MKVYFKIKNDILKMTLTGRWSHEDALAARAKCFKIQQQNNISMILVDISTAQIEMSVINLFEFSASFRTVFPPGILHAVVYSLDANDKSEVEFVETVASNRGTPIKIFEDKNKAIKWLNNNRPTV
jgi:hypothetical protein